MEWPQNLKLEPNPRMCGRSTSIGLWLASCWKFLIPCMERASFEVGRLVVSLEKIDKGLIVIFLRCILLLSYTFDVYSIARSLRGFTWTGDKTDRGHPILRRRRES